ncbi:MAG: hypothetical protein OXP09_08325 [Gammaproteobacteria bacterium]|nr:hypothetical protein [Gammaproteobacteria bacterium]
MSEVSGAGGGYFGSDVEVTDRTVGTGTVSFGGVSISAADAAEFVMMHRTQVMKKVGADRTEMAQQHLDRIKTARKYLAELIDLKKFVDTGKSFRDRAPVTPDLVEFLKNEVGCSPGEFKNRILFYGSAVPRLPESVRDYYGMQLNPDGSYDSHHRGVNPEFHAHAASGHHQYEIHGVTCLSKDKLDSLKEEVNNYVDQQNDSNNLFMTKFKSVINTMNESLEGANSMADKTHDTLKNLVSRW